MKTGWMQAMAMKELKRKYDPCEVKEVDIGSEYATYMVTISNGKSAIYQDEGDRLTLVKGGENNV